jgi:hypothetical protein
MSHYRRTIKCQRQQTSYERLSQRIEEAAERDGYYSNAAIIRRLREHMFADVNALEKSGAVKIPE